MFRSGLVSPLARAPNRPSVRAVVAVGDVQAGDLVVAVVAEASAACVERRRSVAALGEPADGLLPGRVVRIDVPNERRIERVALAVQRVAGVLAERDRVAREEGDV